MKKIAFVVPWYGDNIPGGAETEARNLIKALIKKGLDIEVLTTCVKQFSSNWNKNFYKAGIYNENGVPIRRFKVRKRNEKLFDIINGKLMKKEKITLNDEKIFFEEMVRSIDLETFIEENLDNYSLFCFIPYMFGTTYWGIKKAGKKSLMIPCLHDESYAYMKSLNEIFNLSSGCVFLAKSEKELAEKLYGLENVKKQVIGGGLDITIPKEVTGFKEKYGDITVVPSNGIYAETRSINGGVVYNNYEKEQTQRITINTTSWNLVENGKFKNNLTPNPGDKFNGDIEGVIYFENSEYRLYPVSAFPGITDGKTARETNKYKYDK